MRDWLTHLPYVVKQSWPHGGFDFWPSGRMTVPPRLIVLHSTETTGFPGYNRGAAAPHFTLDLRSGEVRQHVPLSYGSRCLAVSSGGITDRTVNITGTIQIETIGAVTPGYPDRYGHYDLPRMFGSDERAQRHLARLLRAIHDETGIPLQVSSYARFVPYPASYGARAPQRLTSAQFRDARGLVGHQNAPANDHGDGLYGKASNGRPIDLEKVLAMAKGVTEPKPAEPDFPEGPNPANNFFFPEEQIRTFQQVLNILLDDGLLEVRGITRLAEDGDLHGQTMTAVRELQKTLLGFPAEEQDGLPGPRTTKATGELMTVVNDIRQDVAFIRRVLVGPDAPRDPFNPEDGARVPLLNLTWANGHRGSQANGALRQILALLGEQQGVDPEALGAAIADALREDVVAALAEAGASVDASAVADEIGRRLAAPTTEEVV